MRKYLLAFLLVAMALGVSTGMTQSASWQLPDPQITKKIVASWQLPDPVISNTKTV